MRVLYAQSFADDLDEIADYIRADNPGRAVTFVEEIRQVCIRTIVAHPRAGRPRPEFRSGMRSFATHGRTILYIFEPELSVLKFYRVIGRQHITSDEISD